MIRNWISAIWLVGAVLGVPCLGQAPSSGGQAQGSYTPPPCTGVFADVPCSAQFADWIEQLNRDYITSGCGTGLSAVIAYSSLEATRARALVTGPAGSINRAMELYSCSGTILASEAYASGGDSSYGLYCDASSGSYNVTVDSSSLFGATASIRGDSEFTVLVGVSKLAGGGVDPNGGTVRCVACYNGLYLSAGLLACP